MKSVVCTALLLLLAVSGFAEAPWRLALPGWNYEFPRDHSSHPEFKTEWWYFTGNLRDASGRRFGYQLTFFRQGIRPLAQRGGTTSRFICDEFKFAHFAISDPTGKQFVFRQKTSRGAFGEAGFAHGSRLAWINDWNLTLDRDETMHLTARMENNAALELSVRAEKPWVIHGQNGVSQKAEGEGHASHYYSGTRMRSTGRVVLDGKEFAVNGTSWFDQEWATNQLTPGQVGWNWFALDFEDGTELMLYQMRLRDGGLDPNSSGTFIAKDGSTHPLKRDDYTLTPTRWWTSPDTRARYPIAWKLSVPSLRLDAEITTPLERQELVLPPISYWEGMVDVRGTRAGAAVRAEGYMELTGYAGELVGLSQPAKVTR